MQQISTFIATFTALRQDASEVRISLISDVSRGLQDFGTLMQHESCPHLLHLSEVDSKAQIIAAACAYKPL